MTKWQRYPRPPIVEALIEFRFKSPLSPDGLADWLKAKVGFCSGEREEGVHFLTSDDGLRLLGCGAGFLSVHVMAPYPGWENFIEWAQEAVEALPVDIRDKGFDALTVRYIDRIVLPKEEGLNLADYITVAPSLPEAMPSTIQEFHSVTQSVDPETGLTVGLTIASTPRDNEGCPVVLLDLILTQVSTETVSMEGWLEVVEALHSKQRDIFEGTITDRARSLFQ